MTQQYPGDHPGQYSGQFPPAGAGGNDPQHPEGYEFVQIGDDDAINRDLELRRTWKVAPVTAILGAVVLLAAGVTGGVAAHAALAGNSNSNQSGSSGTGFQRGTYPGFGSRGQNGQGAPAGQPGGATIGTVESVSGTTMKVKQQDGTVVTVTLTPNTDIEVTKKGSTTDLTKGSTVAVTGTGDGTSVTARTVRQGDLFGGRGPSAAPSQPTR